MKNLKRMELVDQFEALTIQEIKKHNKAVLESNVAINSLKIGLDSVLMDFEEYKKKIEEKVTHDKQSTDVHLHQLKDELKKQNDYLQKVFRHINYTTEKVEKEIEQNKKNFVLKSRFYEFESSFYDEMSQLKNQIIIYHNDLVSKVELYKKQIENALASFKAEINCKPDPFPEFKKEILKVLEIHKVDSEGITKKIHDYYKDLFVLEKKVEYLLKEIKKLKSEED